MINQDLDHGVFQLFYQPSKIIHPFVSFCYTNLIERVKLGEQCKIRPVEEIFEKMVECEDEQFALNNKTVMKCKTMDILRKIKSNQKKSKDTENDITDLLMEANKTTDKWIKKICISPFNVIVHRNHWRMAEMFSNFYPKGIVDVVSIFGCRDGILFRPDTLHIGFFQPNVYCGVFECDVQLATDKKKIPIQLQNPSLLLSFDAQHSRRRE